MYIDWTNYNKYSIPIKGKYVNSLSGLKTEGEIYKVTIIGIKYTH